MKSVKFEIFVITIIVIYGGLQIECQRISSSLQIPAANNTAFWRQIIDPKASAYQISSSYIDTCSTLQAPGLVCMSDCATLARCVFRNNGWDTIPLQVCDAGQGLYCNAQQGSCSRNPGPCNPGGGGQGGGNFACSTEGVFPDPFNCQMYHMCFTSGPTLIAVNVRCGGNSAFSPITNDCSLSTTHQACQGNQFTCNNPGDMGPWPLNPNIYFICMAESGPSPVFFPQLFRCPMGQIFRAGSCVAGNNGGGGGVLPPGGGNPGLFNCSRAGLFADTFNCRSYFHCDGLLRYRHLTCPSGTYFNLSTLGCVYGSC